MEEYLTKHFNELTYPTHNDFMPDPGPESILQGKIEAWAKTWGKPILSFRQSKAAKRLLPAGWPDVTLILPGRVLFMELKSGKGRLSQEQKHTQLQFMVLGHQIHEVRSFVGFIRLVNPEK